MWYKSFVNSRRRHGFVGIVDVHNHVFRFISDIVYVSDNVSHDIGTDFLSLWMVMFERMV